MSRVIMSVMFALFIGQCGYDENKADSEEEKPNKKVGGNKVADLSFADDSQLHIEVGEKFDVTVNVENIDMDNLDDDLDWRSWRDGSKTDTPTPKKDMVGNEEKMYVILKVIKNDTEQEILARYSRAWKEHDTSIENGMAKFKGLYFTEVCASDCQIVASLRIYLKSIFCPADGGCDYAQVEPVDEISKAVVVKPSSYTAQVERVSGKNIKLTVTKDSKPLADSSVEVRANIGCLVQEPPVDWGGGDCKVPSDSLLPTKTVTLDADGSWSTKLDADGSWESKVSAAYKQETGADYTLNVCDVYFSISIDGREPDVVSPTGGGCS